MKLSDKLKERFCKDCNIPIRIFQEPYFMDRIYLLDTFYDTLKHWECFMSTVINNPKYCNEQDYFEEYNQVKDDAINFIKGSDSYQRFNSEDMNHFAVDARFRNFPSKDIFHLSNVGRKFLSIDMKKANFNALRNYDPAMFAEAATWKEFISKFTSIEHIINSKYIRQVILGNCNPKRHITYEKYLMSNLLNSIIEQMGDAIITDVVFFSNDEIVFDVTDYVLLPELKHHLDEVIESQSVPFRSEIFTLNNIEGISGYYKCIHGGDDPDYVEFKCLDNYSLPFAIRKLKGEDPTENDKVFMFEGRLAKFID